MVVEVWIRCITMSVLKTTAKCVISTSKGDIEVELWAKECPITCKNFMNIALNNDFNGDSFDNYTKGKYLSLVRSEEHLQKSTSELVVEWNSRLSISQDGILCWKPKEKTFFISTDKWKNYPTHEFTIFGMVVGNSIYKFREWLSSDIDTGNSDKSDIKRFIYPPVVEDLVVTISYFTDLKEKSSIIPSNDLEHPKRKLNIMPKVVLSFNNGDDDDENDEVKIIPKIKMKASPLLNRKRKIRKRDSVDNKNDDRTANAINSMNDAGVNDKKDSEPLEGVDTDKPIIETKCNKPKKQLDATALLKKMRASNNGKGMFS